MVGPQLTKQKQGSNLNLATIYRILGNAQNSTPPINSIGNLSEWYQILVETNSSKISSSLISRKKNPAIFRRIQRRLGQL